MVIQTFIETQIRQYLQQARGTDANLNVSHLLELFQHQQDQLETIIQERVKEHQIEASTTEQKEEISSSTVVVPGK